MERESNLASLRRGNSLRKGNINHQKDVKSETVVAKLSSKKSFYKQKRVVAP